MNAALERRARAAGEAAAQRWRARVAAVVRDALPGITIEQSGSGVTLSGRGLVRAVLASAPMREMATWWR